jgi:anti-anti-sigma factor
VSLRTKVKGDVVVVSPEGMLVGGDETHRLEDELRGLMARGKKKIVLDLGRTSHLSSTAIGTLVSVHLHAANNGVAFFACNIDKRIESILAIFKLVNVLNVFGTCEEALEALAKVDLSRFEKLVPGPGPTAP